MRLKAGLAAAAIVAGSSAHAATVTDSDAFGFTITNFTDTLELAQFGALTTGVDFSDVTSVKITLTQKVRGEYRAANRSGSADTIVSSSREDGAYVTVESELTGDDTGALAPLTLETQTGFFGVFNLNADKSFTQTFNAENTEDFSLAALAAFDGNGTFGLTFDNTSLFTDRLSGGSTASGGDIEVRLEGIVEYSYETTSVPVPAALPLLLGSLGALALIRGARKPA